MPDTTYYGDCPNCEETVAFSKGGTFGTLRCEVCEYTPRRKVRHEIMGVKNPPTRD